MLVLLNRFESLLVLFLLMLFSLEMGRRVRLWLLKRDPADKGEVGPVESVVFALLGLLLAFTFTGSWTRFEHRRELITEEANAINTLFWRADLLSPQAKKAVLGLLQEYRVVRAHVYRSSPEIKIYEAEYLRGVALQQKIWDIAVADCHKDAAQTYCATLLLPAIGEMANIAKMRAMARVNHPPAIIYIMLIILSLFSAFLVGLNLPHGRKQNIMYIFGYAVIISLILYLIFDIEMPRHGLINVNDADDLIFEVDTHR